MTVLFLTAQGVRAVRAFMRDFLLATAVMVWAAACWAQTVGAVATERARLQAERERIEVQFSTDEAACRQRFTVTACIDEARQRRRDALAGPRAQALALDDMERKERAATRHETVRERQRLVSQLPPARPVVAPAAASAPASASLPLLGRPNPTRAERPASAPRASAADSAAARRAAAAAERQRRVVETQARIESRQAERLRSGKAAAPLPVPPRSAASSGSAPR